VGDRCHPSWSRRAAVYAGAGALDLGTCAGIARTLELPVWLVRSGFLIALLVGAHAILAYLCLELVMRWDPAQRHLLWSNRLWASLKR
jgi:phage shock protein PspC (stress-responsive transcriptional regulator)